MAGHFDSRRHYVQQIDAAATPRDGGLRPERASRRGPEIITPDKQAGNSVTPELMRHYIVNRHELECFISVIYPKAVQKSYKSEKRFFCPPPSVILSGKGWDALKALIQRFNASYDRSDIKVALSITNTQGNTLQLDALRGSQRNFFQAKTMFISDQEKKKLITLSIVLILDDNLKIGPFLTERIRVISKPSKKKQSTAGTDFQYLSIKSGSYIALYNRLRSQNISTRFLYSPGQRFIASATQWSVLQIFIVSEKSKTCNSTAFDQEMGLICYGCLVRLVDVVTGISLPAMKIRRVSRESSVYQTLANDGEPVSQLHMCAFERTNFDGSLEFMLAHHDNVIMQDCKAPLVSEVPDGARWTIISADASIHGFHLLRGIPAQSITPCPVIRSFKNNEVSDGYHVIEFEGVNFKPDLFVYFGSLESPRSIFRSSTCFACAVPPYQVFIDHCLHFNTDYHQAVDIFMVRFDGVAYSTSFSYKYNERVAGNLGSVIAHDTYAHHSPLMYESTGARVPHYPSASFSTTTSSLT